MSREFYYLELCGRVKYVVSPKGDAKIDALKLFQNVTDFDYVYEIQMGAHPSGQIVTALIPKLEVVGSDGLFKLYLPADTPFILTRIKEDSNMYKDLLSRTSGIDLVTKIVT